eukprot:CAMPEP_0171069356 /NCGR_PEP_ID=MMETSP0766_2-20121228/9096_1 /TAXON_ID=439317 /ORGANISM="Gambierdiscus australes, Strain CAWD 149" /LENGTH=356 /DNA_ID=CAMNT_0011525735 /DNA_START=34 /DNA_END=1104 /DNA_ORIENTATION=-
MVLSGVVFAYEAFVYNVIFLGRIVPALGQGMPALQFSVLFNVVWSLALWSFIQAHRTDPGTVPKQWHEFVEGLGAALPIVLARQEFQPGRATHCSKCDKSRPERAHHCCYCGVCVLRYDHHCPWINNCVGLNNHKFFLLSVLYSCLAGVIAFATALPELFYCVRIVATLDPADLEVNNLTKPTVVAFLIFGVIACVVTILLTMLLTTYLSFAAQNLTTVEEEYINMANPFNLGGVVANFEQIFGALGMDWIVPVTPCRPKTDGIFFPHAAELDAVEVPLTVQRSVPSSGSLGSTVDDACADVFPCQDDADRLRLWRLRYHVHQEFMPQARAAELDEYNWLRAPRWNSCCARTLPEE